MRFWPILLLTLAAKPEDAPADLAKRVAARETATQEVQRHYTYEQTVTIEEFDQHGSRTGEYRELREIIFSPAQERTERMLGKPWSTLRHLKLTEEDFRDIREVQPFLLTRERAFLYETSFRGEETIDSLACWVVRIRPRQILEGQRLFDGMIWVDKQDFSIILSEGEAVPQIRTTKSENLFPRFRTVRRKMDSGYWFPDVTSGDDTLYFRSGPQRIRLSIRYSKYQRFGADTKVTFEK